MNFFGFLFSICNVLQLFYSDAAKDLVSLNDGAAQGGSSGQRCAPNSSALLRSSAALAASPNRS